MPEATDYADESMEELPSEEFHLPYVNDYPDGWGPNNLPDRFVDLPYQKFSKSDRIGKVIKVRVIFLLRLYWAKIVIARLLTGQTPATISATRTRRSGPSISLSSPLTKASTRTS